MHPGDVQNTPSKPDPDRYVWVTTTARGLVLRSTEFEMVSAKKYIILEMIVDQIGDIASIQLEPA